MEQFFQLSPAKGNFTGLAAAEERPLLLDQINNRGSFHGWLASA
jgi:hypothetical protein